MHKFIDVLPQSLLLSFILKMLIIQPSFSDMGIVFVLGGCVATQMLLNKKDDIQKIKDVVNKQNDVIQAMALEISKMKSSVEGIKLKEGFKNAEGFGKKAG